METAEALVSSGEHLNAVTCRNECCSNHVPHHRHALWHECVSAWRPVGGGRGSHFGFEVGANGGKFQLTPSQDVVPEELLFPDKHGHYNQGVQVDSFTQHPENGGGLCVQHHHRQEFTALTDSGQDLKQAFRPQVQRILRTWYFKSINK